MRFLWFTLPWAGVCVVFCKNNGKHRLFAGFKVVANYESVRKSYVWSWKRGDFKDVTFLKLLLSSFSGNHAHAFEIRNFEILLLSITPRLKFRLNPHQKIPLKYTSIWTSIIKRLWKGKKMFKVTLKLQRYFVIYIRSPLKMQKIIKQTSPSR